MQWFQLRIDAYKIRWCDAETFRQQAITEHWTPEMIAGFIELGDDFPDLCGHLRHCETQW